MKCLALSVKGSLFAFLLVLPGWSHGQEDGSDLDEDRLLEEVTVTGSRVRRSNLDSPSPVIVFESSQLEDLGITTLAEFSRYLPQNANLASDSRNTGSLMGSAGFNLRGIGLDGTLTLINGRRIAPFGASGDSQPFVDINAIPVAAIDRIEVLTDGASAIYGSEAVAGVVNIILLQKIEGITAEAGYLTTTEGDGEEWDANIAGGWSNDSTSFNATLSWFDRGRIWSRDRDWANSVDLSDSGGYSAGSSFSSPPTATLLDSGVRLADPECPESGSPYVQKTAFVPGEFEQCSFNYAWFTSLQQPSTRWGMTASMWHEFSGGVTFFAELLANRSETSSIWAPSPIPFVFVPADHPDNPFGEDLSLRFRILDIGNRGFDTVAKTWRVVSGLGGGWGDWEWEAAFTASEAKSDDSRVNGVLAQEFQDAVLGMGGPNGDQYYNPFGLDTQNPQEVIDAFAISGTGTSVTNKEQTVDFQVSGNFGELSGGPVGAAFGGQFRHQSIDQTADPEELSGVISGSAGFEPIGANRDIYSLFAELVVPVLPSLEAQLAVRWDDYSDFGSTTNPKIGLGWRPREDLLVRATWGTSFRPPTFRELFAPFTSIIDFTGGDPFRCPVTGDFFDCRGNDAFAEFQGNPDLEPDEGETWLIGFAWEPSAAPGLSIAVDYWAIEHRNRIVSTYDAYFDLLENLPPENNPFVVRAPQTPEDIALGIPGPIIGFRDTYINADKVTTDGVDVNIAYQWSTHRAGDFTSGITYTYLNSLKTGLSYQEAVVQAEQAGGYSFIAGLPKNRGNFRLGWSMGAQGASMLLNYAGSFESKLNVVVNDEETDIPFVVDDYWQLDLQYNYIFHSLKDGQLRIGCINCLDTDPPKYNADVTNESFHEGRGAMVYVRWTQPIQ